MSSAVTTQAPELLNYVNAAWRRSTATEYVEVSNPATAELLARTPLSTSADVDAAVQAAADAFPAWRRTPPGERVQYLFKLKNLLEENLDELSRLITLENGKTFAEAKAELRRGIENVEVACGIPMMMQGHILEDVTPGVDEMQIRQPLGVVAAITPFNFPAMIAFWFLPYAIACGNTFILKPSERVPRPAASACSVRAARRTTSSSCLTRTWNWPRRSSATVRSAARASDASQFLSPSRLAKRREFFATPSRTRLLQFALAMASTPASKWVRSSPNKASSASSRLFPPASTKAQRPSSMAATPKFPDTNPVISLLQPSLMACLPPASLPTRRSLARYSVSFTPIRLMKPWNFCAAAPTVTRPRFSPPAVPPPANSATRPPRGISASILVSPHRWPISHSVDGKKASSEFFTAKGATPSNSSPNPKSSSSAGRARKRASSRRGRKPSACHPERSEGSAFGSAIARA